MIIELDLSKKGPDSTIGGATGAATGPDDRGIARNPDGTPAPCAIIAWMEYALEKERPGHFTFGYGSEEAPEKFAGKASRFNIHLLHMLPILNKGIDEILEKTEKNKESFVCFTLLDDLQFLGNYAKVTVVGLT